MKALYRKYRPTKLSEVVGQEQVTKNLETSLKKGKISHAYLFTGPRGCGKTSVARIFAHEINGFPYELEDFYPDILEIDAASNTGVDNIRELREKAMIAPAQGKYKVYIIDEVHMLSKSAFNALLKTLEEPPKHVVFIMATTDAYKVPITITSRSQVFEFQLASPEVMLKHLQKIAEDEKIKISSEALEIIVRRGGGSFRDSISLLDQISGLKDGEITAADLEQALGLPEQTKIERLVESYRAGSLAEISENLKTLLNSGVRAEIIAEEIISYILDRPAPDLLPLLKTLPSVSAPFPEAKLLVAFTDSLAGPGLIGSSYGVLPAELKSPSSGSDGGLEPGGVSDGVLHAESKLPHSAKILSPSVGNLGGAIKSGESGNFAGEKPLLPEIPPTSIPSPHPGEAAEPPKSSERGNFTAEKPLLSETSPASVSGLRSEGAADFNWESYMAAVAEQNSSLANFLGRSKHVVASDKVSVVPEKAIYKSILTSPNNAEVLKKCLPEGFGLEILDPGDEVISTNDPQISKISAIMGGTVMEANADGGIPF